MTDKPELGYSSIAEFVKDSVRDRLSKFETRPRLEHINTFDNNVKIADDQLNRIATVYFYDDWRIYCDVCNKDSCIHIDYAMILSEVTRVLKRIGWKRK